MLATSSICIRQEITHTLEWLSGSFYRAQTKKIVCLSPIGSILTKICPISSLQKLCFAFLWNPFRRNPLSCPARECSKSTYAFREARIFIYFKMVEHCESVSILSKNFGRSTANFCRWKVHPWKRLSNCERCFGSKFHARCETTCY